MTKAPGDEQQFAAWLNEGKLPEIRAVMQQRSVRTAHALVESGFRLLRVRPFDALSIAEICAGAGATEGAFYGRFQDKQSYFVVLQRVTCLRSEQALEAFIGRVVGGRFSFEELCLMFVGMTVERYRMHIGIYRASLQHAAEGAWTLFRQLGDRYRRALVDLLSPHLPHVPVAERAVRVQFAYQIVVGALVHATLNDPGPIHLQDDAMITELSEVVVRYLASRTGSNAAS
jgi:AcrR family transcriptional regulator